MSLFNKLLAQSISNESDVVDEVKETEEKVQKLVDEEGKTEVPAAEKAPKTDLEDEVKEETVSKESHRQLPHFNEASKLLNQIAALEALQDLLVNNVSLEADNTMVTTHLEILKSVHGISLESEDEGDGKGKEGLLRRIGNKLKDLRSKVKNFFKGFRSSVTVKDFDELLEALDKINDEERFKRLAAKVSHKVIVNGKISNLKDDGKKLNDWVKRLDEVTRKVVSNYRNNRLDEAVDAKKSIDNLMKGVDLTKLGYDLGYCSAKFSKDIDSNVPVSKRVMYYKEKKETLNMSLVELTKCVRESRDEFDEIKRGRGFAEVANRILKETEELTRRVYNDANTQLNSQQIDYGNYVLKLLSMLEWVLIYTYTEVYVRKGVDIYKIAHRCF